METLEKKFWRCTVCNDIHYGIAPPKRCPTCQKDDKYVEVSVEEATKIMGLK